MTKNLSAGERPRVIFLGNGPLAEGALEILSERVEVVFHAKTREDLETVKTIMNEAEHKIYGVLASFGVLIKKDILELFEPEGILNIHPSMLPDLRGPSPIETAIVRGDTKLGVSVMKLVSKMDAGPIYYQKAGEFQKSVQKAEIYRIMSRVGAVWISEHLTSLPEPWAQDEARATYSGKLDKSMSQLLPEERTAERLLDEIRAYRGFPKSRLSIAGVDCIILAGHLADEPLESKGRELSILCRDGKYLVIDELQPAGKKAMDAKAFLNGYLR